MSEKIIVCAKCGASKRGSTLLTAPKHGCDGALTTIDFDIWMQTVDAETLTEAGRRALEGRD